MPESVEDRAARWAIKLDSRPLSQEESAELERWLESNDRHRGALLRAEATLAYVDRAASLAAGARPDPNSHFGRRDLGRRTLLAALASGALAASLGGVMIIAPWQQRINTATGEIRRVPLRDGSIATVNTESQLRVDIRKDERLIKLANGEAWFEVAHDASRPFIVEAGDVRVRAVGTAFSVRRRSDGADVLVTEGKVLAWRVDRPSDVIPIKAGFKVHIGPNTRAAPAKAEAEIERALAWRNGEIAFDGETLGQAVEEFNRYNERKLVVEDTRLAREPLVGFFKANQPETFARAVSRMIGAKATVQGDQIVITRHS